MNISLVIPYKNEEKKLNYTFKQILNQNHQPDEVIFVNSSSTDNSYNLINILIKRNKKKIKFKNLNTKSINPSMSKNIGIKNSRNDWVAFMDVDQKFNKNWLKSVVNLIKEKKIQCVIGLCKFSGKNNFDVASICQTRGHDTFHEAIPSSIFNKKIFKKYGYFINLRAGYDRHFIKNIKKKVNYKINYQNKIEYLSNSIATNYIDLFKKVFNYTYASLNIDNKLKSFLYLFSLLFFLGILIFNYKLSFYLIFFYILIRGYFFPFIKSKSLSFIKKFPLSVFLLPITGTVIDTARIIAIIKKFLFRFN